MGNSPNQFTNEKASIKLQDYIPTPTNKINQNFQSKKYFKTLRTPVCQQDFMKSPLCEVYFFSQSLYSTRNFEKIFSLVKNT